MCYEGRPGAQALCGCGGWTGSQFCYRFIFQTLKSFKAPQVWFRSVWQGVSLASREGGEKENLFKWECLLISSVPWGSAEHGRGELHTLQAQLWALWQPGLLWPLTRNYPWNSVLQKHPSQGSLLGLSWMGMDFHRQWPAWSLRRGTGDSTEAWPGLCRGRGGGCWGYRALHLQLCHLNPLYAFDTLAFRGLHVKSVMNSEPNLPPGLKCT